MNHQGHEGHEDGMNWEQIPVLHSFVFFAFFVVT